MYKNSNTSRPTKNNASTSTLPGEVKINYKSKKFPNRLNFYLKAPSEEITLEDFETWAIDRLRVLADIEASVARNRTPEEFKKIVDSRLKTYLPLSPDSPTIDTDAERRKDHASHFILRLAFCRSEELRNRFLRAETTLFKIRWEGLSSVDRQALVDSLNFGWEVVSYEEKNTYRNQLMQSSGGKLDATAFENESFFKVHWTKVTDLVERRKVFVHLGKAYVPSSSELSLVMAEFTSRLSKALELTAKALPRLDEDDRLLPILEHLSMGFMAGITSEYTISTGAEGELLTADMVPELSRVSFPFCMRSMADALKSNKHLKHEGRQQFNLFLKGIGLSIEEALIFWRKAFSCTDDKFNKEFKYNFRHGYGLEGSRKNYTPKSCQQIIMGKPPGPGEAHGCPFKHYTEAHLTSSLLTTYNLSGPDSKEVLSFVKSNHFHLACTKVFEVQHKNYGVQKGEGIGNNESVDHPNKYFDASRALIKIETDKTVSESKDELKEENMKVD